MNFAVISFFVAFTLPTCSGSCLGFSRRLSFSGFISFALTFRLMIMGVRGWIIEVVVVLVFRQRGKESALLDLSHDLLWKSCMESGLLSIFCFA